VSSDLRFVWRFFILALVIISTVIGVVFVGFHLRTERLTEGVLLRQGRSLFTQVILTRRWASDHGGVYVKLRPGVEPSQFLLNVPGLKVNIADEDGQHYTLRNPGLIVRELSQIGDEKGLYSFHVASLKPVNPAVSTPDAFEKKALLSFERGAKEFTAMEKTKDGPVYRYMAPLYYEQQCDICHAYQGYKIGDIRGGVSVTLPMTLVNQQLAANRKYSIISALVVLGVLFAFLSIISRRFLRALTKTQGELIEMAATDGLTGLLNRRAGIERMEEEISRHRRTDAPLSCLMLDIDYFKTVNDTYGHLAGDHVLVVLSDALKSSTRRHDIVCRYGGEEFMILVPEANLISAIAVAEKIRTKISEKVVIFDDNMIMLTVSIGVTEINHDADENIDSTIYRADSALYEAKKSGRNRIKAWEAADTFKPSA